MSKTDKIFFLILFFVLGVVVISPLLIPVSAAPSKPVLEVIYDTKFVSVNYPPWRDEVEALGIQGYEVKSAVGSQVIMQKMVN